MTTDRLGPLDAVFLYMEDGISHMHIGSCSVFEGPPPDISDLNVMIRSKLPAVPRYRQRLRFAPGDVGRPEWMQDEHFDLHYHVRHSALPPSAGRDGLDDLMGRLMSQPLDRARPLWEMWMVEGLADGRWALIAKVHHCMVDGVAGTDLMNVMLGTDAPAEVVTAPTAATPAQPSRGLGIGDVASGIRSLVTHSVRPSPRVSLEGSICAQRRWSSATRTLDDVKAIRDTFGGSVNDVVLAAIAGAFRATLQRRGGEVDHVTMRTLVPVSLRRPNDHRPNNQVSMIIAELPIGIADPVDRLTSVRRQMDELKSAHQASAGAAALALADFVPPPLLAFAVRSSTALMRRFPQRVVDTVTTNVPGPRQPLYALGRRMVEYQPFVPLSQGLRTGVAILSYNGQLAFGVTGDYDTVPDVRFIADSIGEQIDVLLARASRRRRTTASGRRLEEVS